MARRDDRRYGAAEQPWDRPGWPLEDAAAIVDAAMPAVLVATWQDGVFAVDEKGCAHELPGRSVRGLTTDGRGGTLAVVDGHLLRRRNGEGVWTTLATADCELSCCVASGGNVYVGTDDARIFCLTANDEFVPLDGFETIEGRETWTAGQMLVDGRLLGPPLGVRSISATPDGVLLANVHVGGVPRSTDAGASWRPTIAVATDVHEVRAHPSRPNIVAAAAALGLCISSDGGATWSVRSDGLHAPYCSAVAFAGDDVLVAASEDPFAPRGRVYRRPIGSGLSPGRRRRRTAGMDRRNGRYPLHRCERPACRLRRPSRQCLRLPRWRSQLVNPVSRPSPTEQRSPSMKTRRA